MGVILDSSAIIKAERRKEPVNLFLKRIVQEIGDQDVALCSIGLTELVHGVYRAASMELRAKQKSYIDELIRLIPVYAYSERTALLAGRIDGEQQARGVTVPFADLLIGATALERGFAVLTGNLRHFRLIPDLQVIPF